MLNLVRDVLDKQLRDRNGQNIGRVDGIILEWKPGEQPEVVAVEAGYEVLARRIGHRTAKFVNAIVRLLHIPAEPRTRIAWLQIRNIGIDITIEADESEIGTQRLERWLRRHVVSHIPMSGPR